MEFLSIHCDVTSDPLAWFGPSRIVPRVYDAVRALLAFEWPPPDSSTLIDYLCAHHGIDRDTAAAWIRRTVDAGTIVEATVAMVTRYAVRALDFRDDPAHGVT